VRRGSAEQDTKKIPRRYQEDTLACARILLGGVYYNKYTRALTNRGNHFVTFFFLWSATRRYGTRCTLACVRVRVMTCPSSAGPSLPPVCIYMYDTHTHIHIDTCVYVCMCVCVHIYILCVDVCICIRVCLYVRMSVYVYVYVCMCVCLYMYECISIYDIILVYAILDIRVMG